MTTPISSISGLISGIDTSSLIDAIIAQERAPAAAMETTEGTIKDQQTALSNYQALLTALQSSVGALENNNAFTATTTSSTAIVGSQSLGSATSDNTAIPAQYTLKVTQLAAAQKLSSTPVTSATAAFGSASTFTIQGQTVNVSATDSLTSLRDKINALNSGTNPTGVTASIITVGANDSRLILTDNNSGAAGITLADTTGTTLHTLGLLDNTNAIPTAAVLVQGADAHFSIDGIALTRTSNTVNDAISGVTLTLSSADATNTSATQITVSRDASAAASAVSNFVSAYNTVVQFLQTQGTVTTSSDGTSTTTQPLYGDSLIRGMRSTLPQTLLSTVFGAATDLATVSAVGLSLGRDGTLSFDQSKFTAAYSSRYNDVVSLFDESRTSSDPSISFVSSGNAPSGNYDVNITAAATAATLSTTGFTGTYDAGATPDSMTVTDTQNGTNITIALTTGMTTAQIVSALQTAMTGAGLAINASANGNDIVLTHQNSGSAAGISISTTGTGDGAAEAWTAPATASGTDIQGTIGGFAATGSGSVLVAATGSALAGVTVRYSGTSVGAVGSVTLSEGAAASLDRTLHTYLDDGGLLASRNDQLTTRNSNLVDRVAQIDARLALRRTQLVNEYAAMEATIAALKQQASSLLGTSTSTSSSSSSSN